MAMVLILMVAMHNRRAENVAICAYEAAEAAIEADDDEFARQYRHEQWRYNLSNNSAADYDEEQIGIIIGRMEKEWQEALPSFSE